MTVPGSGRPFARADYLGLKAATRRACEAAGPLAAISAQTRVDPALLSRYGNPDNDVFVPIDVAVDLDKLGDGDLILQAWADLRGYDLVPRDCRAEAEPSAIARHLAPVAKELSDVIGAIANTSAETPAAAARIEKEVAEASDVLRELADNCRQVRARGRRS